MYDIIANKKNGKELTKEEIEFFIKGYVAGEIPDYQVSALMMAICFQKMSYEETLNLTLAMAHSGDILDLSSIHGIKVDKHSTGGVGDKTSLVLGPLVAAAGVKMAKMSGRGLGHTGGTIDKLESFTGFSTNLTEQQFLENINRIGFALTGQTANLAPADKKLYALRDVTATVDNLSLIASSIMSKKLAAGADVIVLDVKTGSGAFMKKEEDAFQLAKEMAAIGNGAGRKVVAIVSDMDQPLGYAVGNAIEVKEAIATLNGNGPKDLTELCLTLGAHILHLSGIAENENEARLRLLELIENRKALDKLAEFVEAQGGDANQVYHPELLPTASITMEVPATMTGYIFHIQSDEIGISATILGGGREQKEDILDLSVGIYLRKKVGDAVSQGDAIATIYANDLKKANEAMKRIQNAYTYSTEEVACQKFIKGIVS